MRERTGAVKPATKISADIQRVIASTVKVICGYLAVIFSGRAIASMNSVRLRRAAVVKVGAFGWREC
jgi:hypothetical protein